MRVESNSGILRGGSKHSLYIYGGHEEIAKKCPENRPKSSYLRGVQHNFCLSLGGVHVLFPNFRGVLNVALSLRGGTCPFKKF